MQSGKNNRVESQVALKTPPVNFIPYACHFNSQTILTKNGELLLPSYDLSTEQNEYNTIEN